MRKKKHKKKVNPKNLSKTKKTWPARSRVVPKGVDLSSQRKTGLI